MSEMEMRRGKIRKVENVSDVKKFMSDLVYKHGSSEDIEWLEDDENPRDAFFEMMWNSNYKGPKFMELNSELYQILEDVGISPYGFCEIDKNQDGSLSFFAYWHNGGGSLEDVLEEKLKNNV